MSPELNKDCTHAQVELDSLRRSVEVVNTAVAELGEQVVLLKQRLHELKPALMSSIAEDQYVKTDQLDWILKQAGLSPEDLSNKSRSAEVVARRAAICQHLHYNCGWIYAELDEVMGCSPGSARHLICCYTPPERLKNLFPLFPPSKQIKTPSAYRRGSARVN